MTQPGRRTKRTPENRATILRALQCGSTLLTAAQCAGMSDQCLLDWRAADAGFSGEIEIAQAQCRERLVAHIERWASRDWRAAAYILERRDPEWRPLPKQTEVSGANGGPIEHRELPPELTLAELRALAGVDANAH